MRSSTGKLKEDGQRKGSVWFNIAMKQLDSKQTAQGRERLAIAMKLLEKEGATDQAWRRSRIAGACLAAGAMTFPIADAGRIDRRTQHFLQTVLRQVEDFPVYGLNW